MTLPQETIDQIYREAKRYVKYGQPKHKTLSEAKYAAHVAGASEWAGKAQPTIDALEALLKELPTGSTLNFYFTKEQVIKVREELAKYKEVGNG